MGDGGQGVLAIWLLNRLIVEMAFTFWLMGYWAIRQWGNGAIGLLA